jgi:hypothetical protein
MGVFQQPAGLTSAILSFILRINGHACPVFTLSFDGRDQGMINLLRFFMFGLVFFFFWANVSPLEEALGDEHTKSTNPSHRSEPSRANPGVWLMNIYRDHISPVDGDRCPSVPSCSSYALQAFKKHGFFMGWLMTVDRLIHEGEEERSVSPLTFSNGTWKSYDPVENNDFWWFHRDRKRDE